MRLWTMGEEVGWITTLPIHFFFFSFFYPWFLYSYRALDSLDSFTHLHISFETCTNEHGMAMSEEVGWKFVFNNTSTCTFFPLQLLLSKSPLLLQDVGFIFILISKPVKMSMAWLAMISEKVGWWFVFNNLLTCKIFFFFCCVYPWFF